LEPLLSIIIPTHNSELTIEKCINSLTSQSYPREKFEIIVVDDGSTDNTTRIAKNAGADRIIITEPCALGQARNVGVENANSNLLGFIDSDCEAKNDWVKTIVKELETLHAIGGSVQNGNPQSLVAWAEYFVEFSFYNEFKQRFVSKIGLPGCNLACTRDAFNKSGGFTKERLSDDVCFNESLWRAGVDHIFVPELEIKHLSRTKLKKVSKNMNLLGKYFVRNRRKNPSLPYASLKNSKFLVPVAFFNKLVGVPYCAFEAKKVTKFFCSFPYIISIIFSYCKGISDELEHTKPK